MSSYSCIAQWGDSSAEVYTVSFSADETSCYSINSEGKVCSSFYYFSHIELEAECNVFNCWIVMMAKCVLNTHLVLSFMLCVQKLVNQYNSRNSSSGICCCYYYYYSYY